MRRIFPLVLLLLLGLPSWLRAQRLRPGFDKAEYLELVRLNAHIADDSLFWRGIPAPKRFSRLYRSREVGLDNRWELWHDRRGVAVVAIRGTTLNTESWAGNIYAAMLPAKGELKISPTRTFKYQLAEHPRAAVHAGWLLGMAVLADDVLARLDSCYRQGTRDVLITGHSQGGAIAFLLTAHLRQLQEAGRLPADLQLKTVASASPKPGNQPFAVEYEGHYQGTVAGWSQNVINAADWVPETPLSIQKLDDFNRPNAFAATGSLLKTQPLLKRLVLGYVFGRLEKAPRKAQRRYRRYLGTLLEPRIRRRYQPGFDPGPYAPSNDYARLGPTVVLTPDAGYYQLYPVADSQDLMQVFRHHFFQPYQYLAEHLP